MKKFTFLLFFAIAANLLLTQTAVGQISQVGSSETATTASTSLTINKPTGVQIGHVMIATITQSDNDGADGGDLSNPTPPGSGWTVIDGRQLGATGSGGDEWFGTVFYKIATAADLTATNYIFTLDSEADDGVGGIVAFRNVLGGNIFDVTPGIINTGNSDDLNATSITTVTANAAVIMLGMIGDNRTVDSWSTTSPGALTELFDVPYNADLDMGVGAAWALKASAGATGAGAGELSGTENDFHGSILIALRPVNPTVTTANLWSVSGTGALRKYTMDPVTGQLLNGPETVVTPLVSTAAVAKNKITPNDPTGCIYYLNRDDGAGLNGVVTVYSVNPDGTSNGSRGTIDMNGGSNEDFSYVRMGFDDLGRGWILAGSDGSGNIYIASFQGNGTAAISSVNTFGNASLTVAAPGTAAEFQNGDLAITANGTMYALANVTDGQTYVYTLNSLSTPTTLSRRWTVQDNGGTFSGSVNGLAWTQSGSLHFSTSTGIYFIDQFTANQGAGTVQATFVANTDGLSLTDLGSDKFPTQTTLPISLTDFTVTKQGSNAMLNWTTVSENNSSHFEIERSIDAVRFTMTGTKQAAGTSQDVINYQFADPIASLTGIIYYRIKMVDIDGSVTYSKIVPLRLNGGLVKNFSVYPNPFNSDLKIQVNAEKNADITIRISNAAGQQVLSRRSFLQRGDNVIVLSSELSALQAGMYILEIISEDGKMTQKIIKR